MATVSCCPAPSGRRPRRAKTCWAGWFRRRQGNRAIADLFCASGAVRHPPGGAGSRSMPPTATRMGGGAAQGCGGAGASSRSWLSGARSLRRPLVAQELEPFDGWCSDPIAFDGAAAQAAELDALCRSCRIVAAPCNHRRASRATARDARDGGYAITRLMRRRSTKSVPLFDPCRDAREVRSSSGADGGLPARPADGNRCDYSRRRILSARMLAHLLSCARWNEAVRHRATDSGADGHPSPSRGNGSAISSSWSR